MPKCGSQCWLCDVPIRFDTYKGCSHDCMYCFARKKRTLEKIEKDEGVQALKNFVEGRRSKETNWCDWDIPIHWGGLSDPFQPSEKHYRITYDCLKYLAETKYPFIVSTKGRLVADDEYLDLLSQCNCVVQISAVCKSFEKVELGCPSYEERLQMAKKVAPRVKRVIIRIQPYMHEVFDEVYANLEKIADTGAYGVIIEGMKFQKRKPGLVKVSSEFTYPYNVILNDFLALKKRAHEVGLKVYAGENRIREYGDSLTCCGIDGLKGFRPNTYNLNHLLHGDIVEPTEKMKQVDTAECFTATRGQDTVTNRAMKKSNFADEMINQYKISKESVKEVFHIQ